MNERLGRAAMATVLLLAALASSVPPAHAQSTAYSLDDVEGLIASGVAAERILEITRRSCIGFELSQGNTDRLRAAGAEPSLLAALRTVCSPAAQPTAGARTREVQLTVPTTVATRARRVAEEVTLAQRLSASVFRVIGNETGLGFLIDSTGLILTHAQLLRFGERTTVQIDASTHVEAAVVDLDEIRDVAILAIDMSRCGRCRPLRLFTRLDSPPVVMQERLLTVGWGGDSSRHARVGLVREIRQMEILTDVGSSSAATGAPLVNMDGEVVAIHLARVIGLLATPLRGNFALMRIYRDGTELVPVERSRFPALLSVDELRAAGRLVSYQGIHVYRAEDFADPGAVCGAGSAAGGPESGSPRSSSTPADARRAGGNDREAPAARSAGRAPLSPSSSTRI
jgi:S1-C subfamily serine protease